MSRVVYRGVTSKKIYQWVPSTLYAPVGALDSNGNPVSSFTYNSELVIQTNTDGSIARGQASGGDTSGNPGVTPSKWEQS